MGRFGRTVVVVVVVLAAACSSGGGGSAGGTTTTTTSTSVPTTSTTTVEDAVREAYLAYWKMIDRLSAAPNPDDAELKERVVEPLMSFVRDDMTTRRSEGRTTRFPDDPTLNRHRVDQVIVDSAGATVEDCFVDGRIAVFADGTTNADVVTKRTHATLILDGSQWKMSDAEFVESTPGVAGCASR